MTARACALSVATLCRSFVCLPLRALLLRQLIDVLRRADGGGPSGTASVYSLIIPEGDTPSQA